MRFLIVLLIFLMPLASEARSGGSFGGGFSKSRSSSSSFKASPSRSYSSSGSYNPSRGISNPVRYTPSRGYSVSPARKISISSIPSRGYTSIRTTPAHQSVRHSQSGLGFGEGFLLGMAAEEVLDYAEPSIEYQHTRLVSIRTDPPQIVSIRTDPQRFYYDPDFMGPQMPPPPVSPTRDTFWVKFLVMLGGCAILWWMLSARFRRY